MLDLTMHFSCLTDACLGNAIATLKECEDFRLLSEEVDRLEKEFFSGLSRKKKAAYIQLNELKSLRNGLVLSYAFTNMLLKGFRGGLLAKEKPRLLTEELRESLIEVCREVLTAKR